VVAWPGKVEKPSVRILHVTYVFLPVGTPSWSRGRFNVRYFVPIPFPWYTILLYRGKFAKLDLIIFKTPAKLLPILRVTAARTTFHTVPAHVFLTLIPKPHVFISYGTGMAAQTFVDI
jgi:hypothetical protein